MNKIERAIYDCKLHINTLERDVLVLSTELKAYKKQLDALESIEYDKSIPHLIETDKIQGGNK
jgi:hypothetical protein